MKIKMKIKMKRVKVIAIPIILLVTALILVACSSGDSFSDDMWTPQAQAVETDWAAAADEVAFGDSFYSPRMALEVSEGEPDGLMAHSSQEGAGQVEWEDIAGQGERHVIQFANIEKETEDFSATVESLRQLAPAVDGYIESEMLTTRGGNMFTIVLRVPAAGFDTVLRQIEGLAYVLVLNQRAQDVTEQFYDMIASLELRRIEEERLLSLIDDTENINDLLALETRLTNTRISIESYLSHLNAMAGQISYSTITVTLFEIPEEEEEYIAAVPTVGERIGGAFGDSVDGSINAVQNLIVFLAGVVIPLVLIGLVIFVTYKITRRIIKRSMSASMGELATAERR